MAAVVGSAGWMEAPYSTWNGCVWFRVWGLGFRIKVFGVYGLGFTVQGLGFRV